MIEPYGRRDSRWEHGPKMAAIGGGTGLSTMLRGSQTVYPEHDRHRHRGG